MSEDFECDFSEDYAQDKKTNIKKKSTNEGINLSNRNSQDDAVNVAKLKENQDDSKHSKLSKRNLKYFIIYSDSNQNSSVLKYILKDKRITISSGRSVDLSRNSYFMLIDTRRDIIEGIVKKNNVKEYAAEDKKVYEVKVEIKSRQDISHSELIEDYSMHKDYLKNFFRVNLKRNLDVYNIGKGLSMLELLDDETVDTFEAIRNSMIKKEETEKRRSKMKRGVSNRKRSRSSSSSSYESYDKRKSKKKEKNNLLETNEHGFDLNYFKLQYENYLKSAAMFLSGQNTGNINNIPNLKNFPPNFPHGMNPLVNQIYMNQFNSQTNSKIDYPSNPANHNAHPMPNLFPFLNPYMNILPFNPNYPQQYFPPMGLDFSDEQKKHLERININNYNFIKNSNSDSRGKKHSSESSSSSSSHNSVRSSKKGKYFDLKHLNEYKELEVKMKRAESDINLNDVNLMDKDVINERKEKISNQSSSSSDKSGGYEDKLQNVLCDKIENKEVKSGDVIINKSMSNSIHSKNSQDSSSHSSSSSESQVDLNGNKKLFGKKRNRTSSSNSQERSRSDSLSSRSREKYYPKYRNEMRRPYQSTYHRYSSKYDKQQEFRKYENYNRFTNHNQNEYKKRNYNNKYNLQNERRIKFSDPKYRNNFVKNQEISDTKNLEEREIIELEDNYIKENPKNDKDSDLTSINKHKEEVTDHLQNTEEIKSLSKVPEEKSPMFKRRNSNFSNIPTGVTRDIHFKHSNFSHISSSNFKTDLDSIKDQPIRTHTSYNDFRNNNYGNNFHYKNNNYRKYKKSNKYITNNTDQVEQKNIVNYEIKKDNTDNNIISKSREIATKSIMSEYYGQSSGIQNKQNHVTDMPSISTSITGSKLDKINEDKINETNLNYNLSIKTEKSIEKIDEVISTSEIIKSTNKLSESNTSINHNQASNNSNIIQSDLSNQQTIINHNKTNNSTIDKSFFNNIVNQSTTQRTNPHNHNITLNTTKVKEVNGNKTSTDLSSMFQKDNNFKIINVLGKKKIILNKERKNHDIKLKNYK